MKQASIYPAEVIWVAAVQAGNRVDACAAWLTAEQFHSCQDHVSAFSGFIGSRKDLSVVANPKNHTV